MERPALEIGESMEPDIHSLTTLAIYLFSLHLFLCEIAHSLLQWRYDNLCASKNRHSKVNNAHYIVFHVYIVLDVVLFPLSSLLIVYLLHLPKTKTIILTHFMHKPFLFLLSHIE